MVALRVFAFIASDIYMSVEEGLSISRVELCAVPCVDPFSLLSQTGGGSGK